jgi:hypothetical protein
VQENKSGIGGTALGCDACKHLRPTDTESMVVCVAAMQCILGHGKNPTAPKHTFYALLLESPSWVMDQGCGNVSEFVVTTALP